ncbi:MAG: hypothetical protein QOI38_2468 [Sphingomonadales bacterium]|nr:hypothetical protein [Sphingomonadales bacterium]
MGGEGDHQPRAVGAAAAWIRPTAASATAEVDPAAVLAEVEEGTSERDLAPWRRRDEAEICRDAVRSIEERVRFQLVRPPMTPQEAQLELQRAGLVVFRASVTGGRADRWNVRGKGDDITDERLVEMAEERIERKRAA